MGAGHADMSSLRREDKLGAAAARSAARPVDRDDLDVDSTFAAVLVVQHRCIGSVRFGVEADVAVGEPPWRLADRPDEGDAGVERFQACRVVDR
jgi:hypothetical protein